MIRMTVIEGSRPRMAPIHELIDGEFAALRLVAREFGVDNLAETSLVTETRTAPDVRTFYDESTDSDLYAETRDGGDSLSAVDQATDDWMKRLERVFEDTDETY